MVRRRVIPLTEWELGKDRSEKLPSHFENLNGYATHARTHARTHTLERKLAASLFFVRTYFEKLLLRNRKGQSPSVLTYRFNLTCPGQGRSSCISKLNLCFNSHFRAVKGAYHTAVSKTSKSTVTQR